MKTINRNSGVFWAMNQSSTFLGNYYAFLALKGKDYRGDLRLET